MATSMGKAKMPQPNDGAKAVTLAALAGYVAFGESLKLAIATGQVPRKDQPKLEEGLHVEACQRMIHDITLLEKLYTHPPFPEMGGMTLDNFRSDAMIMLQFKQSAEGRLPPSSQLVAKMKRKYNKWYESRMANVEQVAGAAMELSAANAQTLQSVTTEMTNQAKKLASVMADVGKLQDTIEMGLTERDTPPAARTAPAYASLIPQLRSAPVAPPTTLSPPPPPPPLPHHPQLQVRAAQGR
jgi:hypothetical protein